MTACVNPFTFYWFLLFLSKKNSCVNLLIICFFSFFLFRFPFPFFPSFLPFDRFFETAILIGGIVRSSSWQTRKHHGCLPWLGPFGGPAKFNYLFRSRSSTPSGSISPSHSLCIHALCVLDVCVYVCVCVSRCLYVCARTSLLAGLSHAHVLPLERHLPIIEHHRTIPLFRHHRYHHHHHHHRRHLLLCPLIRARSDPVRRRLIVPPIFLMSLSRLATRRFMRFPSRSRWDDGRKIRMYVALDGMA